MHYALLVLALAWGVSKIGWLGLTLIVAGLFAAAILFAIRDGERTSRRNAGRAGAWNATGTDLDPTLDALRARGLNVKIDRTTRRDGAPHLHVKVTAPPGSAEQQALRDFAQDLKVHSPSGEIKVADLDALPGHIAAAGTPDVPRGSMSSSAGARLGGPMPYTAGSTAQWSGLGTTRRAPVSSRQERNAPTMREELKSALIIHREPLQKILGGHKTWEMRGKVTRKRGTIGLIEAGTKTIVGVADLVDCRGPLSDDEMRATIDKHGIAPQRLVDPQIAKWRRAWVLTNVRRLRQPVPYRHKSGTQDWVTLDEDVAQAVRGAL